jgi:membrane protease YdiL (CAAX protease family)
MNLAKTCKEPSAFFFISTKELLRIFGLYILLQLIFSFGIALLFLTQSIQINNNSFGLIQISAISFFSLGILVYLIKKPKTFINSLFHTNDPKLAFSKKTLSFLKPGFITLFAAILATFTVKQLFNYLFNIQENNQALVKQFMMLKDTPLLFLALAITITFLPPLIEEILFRGYLQTWCRQRWGLRPSIFFTAIVFTFFHYEMSLGIGNIEILSSLFVMALFLSYLKEKHKSLWAPIALHASFNCLSSILVWFSII